MLVGELSISHLNPPIWERVALDRLFLTSRVPTQVSFVGRGAPGQNVDIAQWSTFTGTLGNFARITSAGLFSCNLGQSNTEVFGSGASATSTSCVVVGQGASTSQSNCVIVGQAALSSSTGCICIGQNAGTTRTDTYCILLNAVSSGGSSNTFVAGATTQFISNVYIGNGATNAAPQACTYNATGGSGSNIAGANITIAGGIGTGTGAGGSILLKTAAAGTTGSSANTLATVVTIDSASVVTLAGNLKLGTAGNKLFVKTGTNASAGTGTLSGGTLTVTTTACTTSSLIFLTDTNAGALTNVGSLVAVAGSGSFVVTSTNVLDTSTFNWLIVEPA